MSGKAVMKNILHFITTYFSLCVMGNTGACEALDLGPEDLEKFVLPSGSIVFQGAKLKPSYTNLADLYNYVGQRNDGAAYETAVAYYTRSMNTADAYGCKIHVGGGIVHQFITKRDLVLAKQKGALFAEADEVAKCICPLGPGCDGLYVDYGSSLSGFLDEMAICQPDEQKLEYVASRLCGRNAAGWGRVV